MTAPAIQVDNLSVTIDGTNILDDITFAVDHGRHLAVIGPNGAGKTTLLRSLGRLGPPITNSVQVYGRPSHQYTRRELARHIAYVFQVQDAYIPYTVLDFVTMGRYAHLPGFGRFTQSDRRIAQEALDRTGMAGFADRTVDTLSGGERQKVYIAAALAQEPDILLLDEPTTYLDYRHQREITTLIDELHRARSMTIVSVTHDLNQGPLAADDVLALRDGRVHFHGPPDTLLEGGVLRDLYGTDFVLLDHPQSGRPIVAPASTEPNA